MNEQRSEAWFKERLGCVTGSCVDAVLAKATRGKPEATTRRNLKARLVVELLNGKPVEGWSYRSFDMERGEQLEPEARMAYELREGIAADSVGFVLHPTIPRFGASPDAYLGDDGLLELKCPKAANHMDYILGGVLPSEYRLQVMAELACTGRKWADFVSYHPDMPPHLQLFIVRVKRDEVAIAEIEAEVIKFNAEVEEVISKLPKRDGETALEHQLKASVEAINARQ
jgi:putative phage-type endonuclease